MTRVNCLDGLRGVAALWVLIGHSLFLTGASLPVLSTPDLGVDLFILLSGFLMVFQYQQRSRSEDWGRVRTWAAFWIRRFFRIAPLYYLALFIALLLGPTLYADRAAIDAVLGHAAQSPERYLDTGPTNVLLHISFLFGFLPSHAFRTPLPDWSLGLEMQFYAAFPFLVLLLRKCGWAWMVVVAAGLAAAVALFLKLGGLHFPMPAFLPLKMHLFLCGMLIAIDHDSAAPARDLPARMFCIVMLAALPIGGGFDLPHLMAREALVLVFFTLIHARTLAAANVLARLLGTPALRWMGELSYGVYLFHLLFLHRVAAWTFAQGYDTGTRFFSALAITALLAYSLSAATFFLIEMPGQKLGKGVAGLFVKKRAGTELREA